MNSRRKFLFQGAIGTAVLIAYNPFKSIATALSPIIGFPNNEKRQVTFLHIGNYCGNLRATYKQAGILKKDVSSKMILHTGTLTDAERAELRFDVTMPTANVNMM